MNKLPTILFLCRRNSCRSQMAEGWCRALMGDRFVAYSAGIEQGPLDRRAVLVMAEVGIDISKQSSKAVDSVANNHFDYVISVCDLTESECPVFPGGGKRIAQPFDDPPKLASLATAEEEKLIIYRKGRDEIREFVNELPELLCKA